MIKIEIPTIEELLKIDIKRGDTPKIEGIYFLINSAQEVIYIGQSVNIYNRIRAHLGKSKTASPIRNKEEICYIAYLEYSKISPHSIDGIERIYIDIYKPKYNDIPIVYLLPSIEGQREALKNIPMR